MKRLGKPELLARLEASAECLMCAMQRALPIATSEHAIAVLDRYAARPGHVLVIARRHEEKIAALSDAEHADLHRLVHRVCRGLEAALLPRRIYVAALGAPEPLPMSSPHVHVHVVPLSDPGDRPADVFTWANGAYVFQSHDEEKSFHAALVTAIRSRSR